MLREIHNTGMPKDIFKHCKHAFWRAISCQNFVKKSQLAVFEGKLQVFLMDLTFFSRPIISLIKTN